MENAAAVVEEVKENGGCRCKLCATCFTQVGNWCDNFLECFDYKYVEEGKTSRKSRLQSETEEMRILAEHQAVKKKGEQSHHQDKFPLLTYTYYMNTFCKNVPVQDAATAQHMIATRKAFLFNAIFREHRFGRMYVACVRNSSHKLWMKVNSKKSEMAVRSIKNELSCMKLTQRTPFFLQLKGQFQTRCGYYIVSECQGQRTLEDAILTSEPFTGEVILFYSSEMAVAIGFLHEHNIIHRNDKSIHISSLSASTIIIDAKGHVLLTDFSFVYFGTSTDWKCYGAPLHYLAPEMIKGIMYTQSVDWWALGVIVYLMMYKEFPFHGKLQVEVLSRIVDFEPKFPRDSHSKELLNLVRRLLHKEPRSRLGKGERGTLEVYTHSFFNKVTWLQVEKQALKPPVRFELPHKKGLALWDNDSICKARSEVSLAEWQEVETLLTPENACLVWQPLAKQLSHTDNYRTSRSLTYSFHESSVITTSTLKRKATIPATEHMNAGSPQKLYAKTSRDGKFEIHKDVQRSAGEKTLSRKYMTRQANSHISPGGSPLSSPSPEVAATAKKRGQEASSSTDPPHYKTADDPTAVTTPGKNITGPPRLLAVSGQATEISLANEVKRRLIEEASLNQNTSSANAEGSSLPDFVLDGVVTSCFLSDRGDEMTNRAGQDEDDFQLFHVHMHCPERGKDDSGQPGSGLPDIIQDQNVERGPNKDCDNNRLMEKGDLSTTSQGDSCDYQMTHQNTLIKEEKTNHNSIIINNSWTSSNLKSAHAINFNNNCGDDNGDNNNHQKNEEDNSDKDDSKSSGEEGGHTVQVQGSNGTVKCENAEMSAVQVQVCQPKSNVSKQTCIHSSYSEPVDSQRQVLMADSIRVDKGQSQKRQLAGCKQSLARSRSCDRRYPHPESRVPKTSTRPDVRYVRSDLHLGENRMEFVKNMEKTELEWINIVRKSNQSHVTVNFLRRECQPAEPPEKTASETVTVRECAGHVYSETTFPFLRLLTSQMEAASKVKDTSSQGRPVFSSDSHVRVKSREGGIDCTSKCEADERRVFSAQPQEDSDREKRKKNTSSQKRNLSEKDSTSRDLMQAHKVCEEVVQDTTQREKNLDTRSRVLYLETPYCSRLKPCCHSHGLSANANPRVAGHKENGDSDSQRPNSLKLPQAAVSPAPAEWSSSGRQVTKTDNTISAPQDSAVCRTGRKWKQFLSLQAKSLPSASSEDPTRKSVRELVSPFEVDVFSKLEYVSPLMLKQEDSNVAIASQDPSELRLTKTRPNDCHYLTPTSTSGVTRSVCHKDVTDMGFREHAPKRVGQRRQRFLMDTDEITPCLDMSGLASHHSYWPVPGGQDWDLIPYSQAANQDSQSQGESEGRPVIGTLTIEYLNPPVNGLIFLR